MNPVLISHSTKDAKLSAGLAKLLERCSLKQINPWFSSDPDKDGGLAPGDRWFETIRSKLKTSKAVLVLITPNSCESSWVQFEAGFGAAHSDLEIMPLLVGIKNIADIPDPLSHWQVYRLDNLESCSGFLGKLLSRLGIHYDAEFVQPAIQDLTALCMNASFEKGSTDLIPSTSSDLERLQGYLEKKLFDIQSRLPRMEVSNFSGYYVYIENEVSHDAISLYVEEQTTFLDALNEIYFQIEKQVQAWSYLHEWVLTDIQSGQKIVLREISSDIPAHCIFKPDRMIVAQKLSSPYSGQESYRYSEE